MDIATAASAYSALKTAKDIFSSLLEMKINQDVRVKVNEALSKLGDAQDTLFELREQLSRLQDENANLRKTIESRESWKTTAEQYALTKAPGGAVVLQSKGNIGHYVCPRCFEGKEVQILQDDRVYAGTYSCPKCKTKYPVNRVPESTGGGHVMLA